MKPWQRFLAGFITVVFIVLVLALGLAIISASIKGLLWLIFLLFEQKIKIPENLASGIFFLAEIPLYFKWFCVWIKYKVLGQVKVKIRIIL